MNNIVDKLQQRLVLVHKYLCELDKPSASTTMASIEYPSQPRFSQHRVQGFASDLRNIEHTMHQNHVVAKHIQVVFGSSQLNKQCTVIAVIAKQNEVQQNIHKQYR